MHMLITAIFFFPTVFGFLFCISFCSEPLHFHRDLVMHCMPLRFHMLWNEELFLGEEKKIIPVIPFEKLQGRILKHIVF